MCINLLCQHSASHQVDTLRMLTDGHRNSHVVLNSFFFFLRKLSDVPVPVSYELLEKIAQLFNLTA